MDNILMKKHNPYIIITTTIIVLAILFVSFNPLSVVQYDYSNIQKSGNGLILTIETERFDDTLGFDVQLNDDYLNYINSLPHQGMILKCVVNAEVVNPKGLMKSFTMSVNGIAKIQEIHLICDISSSKELLYKKARDLCDLSLTSSRDNCISSSRFSPLTKVTWSYSIKDDDPIEPPTPDNLWILYLIIGLIVGALIFVYIKSKGGKKWLKMLKVR